MRRLGEGLKGRCLLGFTGFAKDRGWMAGNGGEMAEQFEAGAQEKKTRVKADVITRVKATVRTGAGKQAGKSKDAAGEETAATDRNANGRELDSRGVADLHSDADKLLGQMSRKVTDFLLLKTFDGDLRCAKMLFLLAEPQKGRKAHEKNRQFRSAALMLAAEPEWQGEQPGAAESGGEKT